MSVDYNSHDLMTEIAIGDQDREQSNALSSQRPATLPVASPFGPPMGAATSSRANSDNTVSTTVVSALISPKTPIDAIREWSLTTFKCTKQLVNEKLGKAQRTVDSELEGEINALRETQRKYSQILKISREMMTMYSTLVQQQTLLYESLSELALKETKTNSDRGNDEQQSSASSSSSTFSLGADFRQNSDMLRQMAKNGEKLILALKFFCNNLSTLVNKTIEDTIVTIKAYEHSRLEYDAEKNSVANLLPAQAASAANTEKLIAARAKYDRLRDDVAVKMKFLDENKAKVMHKQLILFHNAFAAYASGNASALDTTLKQFSIKPAPQSFLEK
ncbi:arfaptin-2-like protein [Dinothrombium tinctorium]|uniref:Arfaptin-2-like protein n=1 Tax=Dinothrombium tinctorium TaxID=1965070 RepID=A0A443RNY5_9ACAR|nr:arfaptin-2-like protein [Dinothrombium tinctorium]